MQKAPKVRARYQVAQAFDYLTAGREYDFEYCPSQRRGYVNVRRADDGVTGTFLQQWQFRQALANGWLMAA